MIWIKQEPFSTFAPIIPYPPNISGFSCYKKCSITIRKTYNKRVSCKSGLQDLAIKLEGKTRKGRISSLPVFLFVSLFSKPASNTIPGHPNKNNVIKLPQIVIFVPTFPPHKHRFTGQFPVFLSHTTLFRRHTGQPISVIDIPNERNNPS